MSACRCRPAPPTAASTSGWWPSGSACRWSTTTTHGVWALGPEAGGRARSRRRWPPSSSSPTLDGEPSGSRACAGRRCCSSRGRRGEAAASTCPCGRPCGPSCTPTASRSSPSRSTGGAEAARPFDRSGPPRAPLADRPGARHRRAVRLRQRAQRRLDRRGRRARAPGRAGLAAARAARRRRSAEIPDDVPAALADMLARGAQDPHRSRRLRRRAARLGRARRAEPVRAVTRRGRRRGPAPARRGGPRRGRVRARPAPVARRATTTPPSRWPRGPPAPPRQLDLQAPGVELRRPLPGSHRRLRQRLVRGHPSRSAPRTTTPTISW